MIEDKILDTDVLIIGAGIAGISAACHLKKHRPNTTFAILEGREQIGGTWSLFRYPGIRSDSDMPSFAFGFKPWTDKKAIADAHVIHDYLQSTVHEYDIDQHIRFGYHVISASFSSAENLWTVTTEHGEQKTLVTFKARVLLSCTGYYDYNAGYTPTFEGMNNFKGLVVHPQHWPENLDYTGKRVVVIGSGATAVTLIPAMTGKAGHVTMLQRSPGYVVSLPSVDPISNMLNKLFGHERAYPIIRRKNIALSRGLYKACQKFPDLMRKILIADVRRRLPKDFDVDTHFSPRYNPWDERLCVVPDGDLFKAFSSGKASVETDRITRFTEKGILLESGKELEADIIVTATGLNMLAFGGIHFEVDGQTVQIPETTIYKSMMLSSLPNFAFAFGYTNIAWTLKVDLTWQYLCRLLDYMDQEGHRTFEPIIGDPTMIREPFVDLASGYVQRGLAQFPKAGTHEPWTFKHAYELDKERLCHNPIADHALHFTGS